MTIGCSFQFPCEKVFVADFGWGAEQQRRTRQCYRIKHRREFDIWVLQKVEILQTVWHHVPNRMTVMNMTVPKLFFKQLLASRIVPQNWISCTSLAQPASCSSLLNAWPWFSTRNQSYLDDLSDLDRDYFLLSCFVVSDCRCILSLNTNAPMQNPQSNYREHRSAKTWSWTLSDHDSVAQKPRQGQWLLISTENQLLLDALSDLERVYFWFLSLLYVCIGSSHRLAPKPQWTIST